MDTDKGLFLSFDGVPRSGRTTQADRLAESLRLDGHDVVRVSMPEDLTPIAKTSLAWLSGRLAAYLTMVDAQVRPALEAGNIVILDGGITSALIRTRAVMGANAPLGLLYLHDCRAMRPAPVDLEWIFLDEREGQRKSAGFDCASLWKAGACCHAKASSFPDSTSCGGRRHATYLMRAKHADAASEKFGEIVAHLLSERMSEEWAPVVAQSQDERDLVTIARRMEQWTADQPMPLYSVVANWNAYTDATRLAAVQAIPARQGAVEAFVRALRSSGVDAASAEINAVLAEKDAAEVAAEKATVDATEAPTEVA